LGCRHHARPAARGCRRCGADRASVHSIPGRVRLRPRGRRRGTRVAGGRHRPRPGLTGDRSSRCRRSRQGRRGAGGVPARHKRTASGGLRRDRGAVGPWRPRRRTGGEHEADR
jgi:hypothetical protein